MSTEAPLNRYTPLLLWDLYSDDKRIVVESIDSQYDIYDYNLNFSAPGIECVFFTGDMLSPW